MIETWYQQDTKKPVQVKYLDGNVFSADNNGNKVGVELYNGTSPVNVVGSVSANVIRSDGQTVAVTGDSSANKAWVILPEAAYAVPGVISVIIKLTHSGDITTICAIVANVYMSSTDTVVDPGTIIPSIQDLLDAIQDAVETIPPDATNLWKTFAPAFSNSTAYTVGQYVTYSGKMYRFTAAHPAGNWDSSHVTAVNVGGELKTNKDTFDSLGLYVSSGYVCQKLSNE